MDKRMMPKSVQRFSDHIMRKKESMMPKNVQRFSDHVMRKTKVCDDA
jgi:hypothetical protein